jgi:predicted phage terminase large subunit-like protein
MQITKTEVLAEQYRRSFYRFAKESFKVLHNGEGWVDNWHIKYICDEIQKEVIRINRKEPTQKNIIINVPPRTLKSELVNVLLSAYSWIINPSLQIITSSYSSSLSISLSVQTRRLLESDWFIKHFPNVKLSIDENTKSRFSNTDGGLRYSTSTGGTVTGMGGDLIIIDDPQNPQLSRSDVERENTKDFFNQTLRSRLNNPKTGVFIIIMQRLHDDDLTGHLLRTEPEHWKHICLPAELNDNVYPVELINNYHNGLLFEQRLSLEVLGRLKTGLGSYGYSGQYLQSPSPTDGGILKSKWINPANEIPNGTVDFFLDTAYTSKQGNDPTAIMACIFENNNLYLLKVVEQRLEFPELIKYINEFVHTHNYTGNSRIYIEPKASGLSVIQQMRSLTSLNIIESKPPTTDKINRANSISAFVESGRVYAKDGAYLNNFYTQLNAFPNALHDDMVDVFIMAIEEYTAYQPAYFG